MKHFFNVFCGLILKKSKWSIGLYEATKDEPFKLTKLNIKYPLLSVDDITDCVASFIADPFLVKNQNKIYIFFEIMDKIQNKGIIGVASSEDGLNYKYEKIVLEENFHLSYPAIYKVNNQFYMIPESGEINEVRIYKSVHFPYTWEYHKTILKGPSLSDATLYFYDNLWYLFVSDASHAPLNIYYSDTFDGDYTAHTNNPIYMNKQISRPAGSVFKFKDKLYRFSQDCSKTYGEKVNLFKIESLGKLEYEETFIKNSFFSNFSCRWNSKKMHHLSYLELENKYLVATDGIGYKNHHF